jgi:Kelch motif
VGERLIASGQSGAVYWLRPDLSGWEAITDLAFPRVFHQFIALNDGRALAVGGIVGMQRVDRIAHIETISFDTRPEPVARWELDAPGPAKNRQGIFLRQQQMYLFGGNNSLGQHDFAAENFVSAGYHLDLGSLSFKEWVAFPAARQSVQTLDVAGSGYAVGGFGLSDGKQRASADFYRFDFESEKWSRAEHGLAEPRTQFGLTEYADKVWVFGGMDFDDSRKGSAMFAYPTQVLVADAKNPDAGFVDAGFGIPRPRRAFASARLGSKYFLVGGMEADFKPVPDCDVYDFETRTWSHIPAPPTTRIGAEMVGLNGKLYLTAGRVVGSDVEDADKRVEVFDPATGTWKTWAQPLPIKDTRQMRLLPFGTRLLAYTAQREDAKIELLVIDPSAVSDSD